ncbi:MAG: BtrH N-terminal domain-containing protein [Flavobacteriales bacterium]|nr:BtrH N-terminal domain-containing protein [Flavobacteriales bacterium]
MTKAEISPFIGQHCETTATGTLLNQIGIELSEPLLFGLGEGLSYIFWNMKGMDFPFIGGRVKPDQLTQNICKNLGLVLEVQETTSMSKAWKNVKIAIDQNQPVGLKLDCYHLDYFKKKIHFAAHYAALYAYDETHAYLIDTAPQGTRMKTSLESLARARNEKGPMASKNLSYTINKNASTTDLKVAIKNAIVNNTKAYLNPPISNISYKGISKTAKSLKKWFENSQNIKRDFQTTAMMMERAGTGGAIFRNLFRDFLNEASEILKSDFLKIAFHEFEIIAAMWTKVANLFHILGENQQVRSTEIIADLLEEISTREYNAIRQLQTNLL